MNLFYAATTITLGNGEIAPFWESPWLNGRKPKDIAPLIFDISSRKKWSVKQALQNNAWISKIKMDANLTTQHIREYIELWVALREVHLHEDTQDTIVWNLTTNGEYTSASAYKAQFFGAISSNMNKLVWKAWAPPKIKFFAWLAIQNRLWTADRLEKRGWDNCGLCPLCKQTGETATHLFSQCRYSRRLWGFIKDWVGTTCIRMEEWTVELHIEDWWTMMASKAKAMASVTMLASWLIWKERNARVFNNKSAPPTVLFDTFKNEARFWATAGAKHLSSFMPGE
jgi:hypothetical protein